MNKESQLWYAVLVGAGACRMYNIGTKLVHRTRGIPSADMPNLPPYQVYTNSIPRCHRYRVRYQDDRPWFQVLLDMLL